LIEKYKITIGPIVPPVGKVFLNVGKKKEWKRGNILKHYIAVHFAKNPIVTKYDLSSLRFISSGAAPLGREHIEALNLRIKAPVRQG
jgi:acyl-coenzyme A synthetase/AMP-(fatty) acid ligase